MCLILIAHRQSVEMPLLVLANRDEFYSRPTAAASRWPEAPGMVAGRDLVSGGTWFGARNGRWAAVTNVREGVRDRTREPSSKSRGWLVRDYLQGEQPPQTFLHELIGTASDFAGFNLLLGAGDDLWYSSNRGPAAQRLEPGVYGLSNHVLDTPWPKVVRGKRALNGLLGGVPRIDHDLAFAILADTVRAADSELPKTGIPLHWEQGLSAIFVAMPTYGTRSAALLERSALGATRLFERRFAGGPETWVEDAFQWEDNGSLLDR